LKQVEHIRMANSGFEGCVERGFIESVAFVEEPGRRCGFF